MKTSSTFLSASLLGLAAASPLLSSSHRHDPIRRHISHIYRREVPQEHSHDFVLTTTNEFLALKNPKGITDAVFGLLGNAAAAEGAGDVTNLDCLKQETADQAFTNAKAAGDLRGMSGALLFQAIERNSAKVGAASVLCTQKAVNPEIAALTQHQDAASANAGALNKAITLELASQLAGIGADPNLALLSGTFAAGDPADPTGAGNSCDDEEPELGCIFSQGLLVMDASQEEVAVAAADVVPTFTGTGGIFATDLVKLGTFSTAQVTGSVDLATVVNGAADTGAGGAANATSGAAAGTGAVGASAVQTPAAASPACSVLTTTVAAAEANAVMASATAASVVEATGAASGTVNIQSFTGTLGGAPPAVESSAGDRPFSVNGDTFTGEGAALSRSCDVQHNACFNAINSGTLSGGTEQCEQQVADCKAASALRRRQVGTFGTCTDPSIVFEEGLDGRTGAAFAPADTDDFNHGSAQKIGIIAGFICQQLSGSCNAGTEVAASCASASSAAVAETQDQTAADTFNQALGAGSGGGNARAVTPAATGTPAPTAAAAASSVVMAITEC